MGAETNAPSGCAAAEKAGGGADRIPAPQSAQILRREFLQVAQLDELAASIKERGIIQPIAVRPARGATDAYEIIVIGERRCAGRPAGRACDEVPVAVLDVSGRSKRWSWTISLR